MVVGGVGGHGDCPGWGGWLGPGLCLALSLFRSRKVMKVMARFQFRFSKHKQG